MQKNDSSTSSSINISNNNIDNVVLGGKKKQISYQYQDIREERMCGTKKRPRTSSSNVFIREKNVIYDEDEGIINTNKTINTNG